MKALILTSIALITAFGLTGCVTFSFDETKGGVISAQVGKSVISLQTTGR